VTRLLLDLNVVLDVLLERPSHAAAAAGVWTAVETGRVEGLLPAHGFTTVFYLTSRHESVDFARHVLEDLVSVFAVAPVDAAVIRKALSLGWSDFEEAVCAAAAEAAGCELIVTRDPTGFERSPVRVVDPGTALALLSADSL
jgi:predicted nucleic acid-binding protein